MSTPRIDTQPNGTKREYNSGGHHGENRHDQTTYDRTGIFGSGRLDAQSASCDEEHTAPDAVTEEEQTATEEDHRHADTRHSHPTQDLYYTCNDNG